MPGLEDPGDSALSRDRRDREADAREFAADARERDSDIREGVLDRWERELTERAISLEMFDPTDAAERRRAREARTAAHGRRRAEAERRHDAAIERGIARAQDAPTPTPPRATLGGDTDDALAHLAALADTSLPIAATLDSLLAFVIAAIDGVAAASVALRTEGQLLHAAGTQEWAAEFDAAQLAEGRGPLVDAAATHTVVVTSDLTGDLRWQLAGALGADGTRGAVSAPIVVDGEASGVLTLYAHVGARFDRIAVVTAGMVAAYAALAVAQSLERLSRSAQTQAWERALASRDQIGQAKGILMHQLDVTADGAFDLMRAVSQRRNVKVRDVAEHVVAHGRLPDES